MQLKDYVKDIPDFPEKGIIFRDITPILQSPEAFSYVIDQIAAFAKEKGADLIVGPEARGFIVGLSLIHISEPTRPY